MRADLRLFRYAVAVADEAGFARAASRLGISQPPLSQRIAELESSLGVKLFDRRPFGAVPTSVGKIFLEQARVALREADRAMDMARGAAAGDLGELKLTLAGGAMFSFLPKLLRDFCAFYPRVTLSIRNLPPDEQILRIAEGAVDVGFTRIAPCPPSVSLELLHSEAYLVALPSGHRFSSRGSIKLGDLSTEPFVMFHKEGSGFHLEVVALCLTAGFSPRVAQEIAPMHAIVSLVGAGLGIAVVPDSAHVLAFPGVIYKPLRGLERASRLYLASHSDARSAVCNSFINFAHKHFGA